MATTYNYSRATYFAVYGINPGELFLEIENNTGITKTLNKVLDDGSADIKITFDTALNSGEKTTLDGIVTAHKPIISFDKIEIQEEFTPTGGSFQCETRTINTNASESSTNDYTWDIPINVLAIYFVTTSAHEGDNLELSIGPDTTIGTITSDVSVSDTVINVSQTVIDNTNLGDYMKLFDGTNTNDLGIAIAKDAVAKTITVKTATTNSFFATTPTYVQKTHYFIKSYEIGPPWEYVIGESKIGSSYIPANTIVRFKYINNSASNKKLIAKIEYLR